MGDRTCKAVATVIALLMISACVAPLPDDGAGGSQGKPPEPVVSGPSASEVRPISPAEEASVAYEPQKIAQMLRETPKFDDWRDLWAWLELVNDMASLGPGIPLEAEFSPTVQPAAAQEVVDAYSQAMGLWTFFGVEDVNVVWTLMSENDYEWWRERVLSIEGDKPALDVWNPESNLLGHCYLRASSFCGYGNAGSVPGTMFQYNVIGSKYSGGTGVQTVIHEAVHFYQTAVVDSLREVTPCWFEEGQASLIGLSAAGYPGGLSYGAKHELNRFGQRLPGDSSWSADRWKDLFDRYVADRQTRNECSGAGYTTGAAAFEYLYMNYSMWTIHEVTLLAVETGSWEMAVEEVLGITSGELNSGLADYMVFLLADVES